MGDRHTCFYDVQHERFLLASPGFSKVVSDLYQYLFRNENIYISAQDMPAFYTAVIKPMIFMVNFKGLDALGSMIPPETVPQLYIDCGEENEVFANLTFTYGEQIFPAFACRPFGAYYDPVAEDHIEQRVLRYFTRVPDDEQHPLVIADSDAIYLFLTEGLPELSKYMEAYASDRFRKIAVRPPVKASVGIRPDGGLLELSIADENYTPEELIVLLSSYRKGTKCHRLKDGSFVLMDESAAFWQMIWGLDFTAAVCQTAV